MHTIAINNRGITATTHSKMRPTVIPVTREGHTRYRPVFAPMRLSHKVARSLVLNKVAVLKLQLAKPNYTGSGGYDFFLPPTCPSRAGTLSDNLVSEIATPVPRTKVRYRHRTA